MIASTLIAGALLLSPLTQDKTSFTDTTVGKGTEAAFGDIVTVNLKVQDEKGNAAFDTKSLPPAAWVLGARQADSGSPFLVLPELDKAIRGMKAGGLRKISIPASLGFGELSFENIAANSNLVIEVELFDVRKKGSQPELKKEEIIEGKGDPIKQGDTISAHYRGKFLNGSQFDSSYERQQQDGSIAPVPFNVQVGVTRLIPGFTQGLIGMKAGGRRKVTIPYDMAYKEAGRPPVIPKYSVLVFELEVLSVQKGG